MKATLLSALVFSALLAAPVFAQEPAAAPPADPGAAPRIVCEEPIFDFGDKNNSESVEHNYVIRNTGNVSLEIQDVRASCGCTAVKPSQNTIPPGGDGFITAADTTSVDTATAGGTWKISRSTPAHSAIWRPVPAQVTIRPRFAMVE